MAHRRGSFRGVSPSQKRKKTWLAAKTATDLGQSPGFSTSLGFQTDVSGLLAGQSSKVAFVGTGGTGVGGDPFTSVLGDEVTILRTRGSLVFPKNEVDGSTGVVTLNNSFGIGVTAIGDGTLSSFPSPITDVDWDGWMFLRQSGVGPVDSTGTVIDIKAMRKIQDGECVFFAAESAISIAGQVVVSTWTFDLRFLIMLP